MDSQRPEELMVTCSKDLFEESLSEAQSFGIQSLKTSSVDTVKPEFPLGLSQKTMQQSTSDVSTPQASYSEAPIPTAGEVHAQSAALFSMAKSLFTTPCLTDSSGKLSSYSTLVKVDPNADTQLIAKGKDADHENQVVQSLATEKELKFLGSTITNGASILGTQQSTKLVSETPLPSRVATETVVPKQREVVNQQIKANREDIGPNKTNRETICLLMLPVQSVYLTKQALSTNSQIHSLKNQLLLRQCPCCHMSQLRLIYVLHSPISAPYLQPSKAPNLYSSPAPKLKLTVKLSKKRWTYPEQVSRWYNLKHRLL